MLLRKTLLLLFLLFCCAKGFAATFVVTSNADSGPGTLRDALTQATANGTAEMDYINFNLPDVSQAGRTITLLSKLPLLSDNLVVDGETQPGSRFGVSGAKVQVFSDFQATEDPDFGNTPYVFGAKNTTNVTLTGLWMVNKGPFVDALDLMNVNQMTINYCLIEMGDIRVLGGNGFIFQSNIFGFMPDGKTAYAPNMNIRDCYNTTIGGSAAQGNLFACGLMIANMSMTSDWNYNISYNRIGCDYTGLSLPAFVGGPSGVAISISNVYDNLGNMHGVISNNEIVDLGGVGLYVGNAGNVSITGNTFNTDSSGKLNLSNTTGFTSTMAIELENGIYATVGGSNPGDKNIIAYCGFGVGEQGQPYVVMSENSIFCTPAAHFPFGTHNIPAVQVNSISANTISGTATAGARVELFYDNDGPCKECDPKYFLGYTTADAQGNWTYTSASVPSNIIASSIYNNHTSIFTHPIMDSTAIVVKQTDCGTATGSIQGIKIYNTGAIQWTDQNGKVVSNSPDVFNLPPGEYQLTAGSSSCGVQSNWIVITDPSPKIDTKNMQVLQPSCNKGGSITGIIITSGQKEAITINWFDANQHLAGNTADVTGLPAGKYTLVVTGQISGCKKTYGPVTLNSSPAPAIDQSQAKIQSTNCGQTTGSITNLIVTGTGNIKYTWTNNQQQIVGYNKDLTNQPAGTYKLEVTDDSQCGPIYSTDITIPETNSITMDETGAQITPSSCGLGTGSVTGIKVTGADKYQWVDANNNVFSYQRDLTNAPPGTYTLTATNATGCSKTSQPYTITALPPTVYPAYPYVITNTCPNSATGSITVTVDNLVTAFQWYNSAGKNEGFGSSIQNMPADTYTLYLTDVNGCPSRYQTYTINNIVPVTIQPGSAQVTSDQCNLKTGGITGIQVKGGIQPYTYSWADANGNSVSTSVDLGNVGAGTYTLTVTDASGCTPATATYTIQNTDTNIPTPLVSNVQICGSGSAIISVNNASATGTYNLYDSENSTTPVDQQTGGKFRVNVTSNTSFYITQINGSCESSKAKVDVTVGLSTLNIANTFTPNGDGINDYWKINNIENYPQAVVQVFTRYGQKVFESKGYQIPFDGTYKGQNLPAGVYYFIIDLHSNCSLLSGSLTILR